MSADVVVCIYCDYPTCQARRETRRPDAQAATARLAAIDAGWIYREGDDYCPTHRASGRRR